MTSREKIDYEEEFRQIKRRFPRAHFDVSMPLAKIDSVVSRRNRIKVIVPYDCYCYDECPKKREADVFVTESKDGGPVKMSDVIEEMIRKRYRPCNHRFFEGLHKGRIPDVFVAFFGS